MPESGAAPDRAVLEPLAREALAEITNPKHIGALRDVTIAEDVATVRFSTTQGGYPGWAWTVSIAVNPGMEPAILETELMPGDGALVAPDWVPWADRLEDYLAQQAEAGAGDDAADEESEDDSDDDEHDDDDHELDDDVDGVDIDLHADDVDADGDDDLDDADDDDDDDDHLDDDDDLEDADDEDDDDDDDDDLEDADDADDDSGL